MLASRESKKARTFAGGEVARGVIRVEWVALLRPVRQDLDNAAIRQSADFWARVARSVDHPVTLGSSSILRTQAAFHSALLICVARSQNPMQSASDLPPPPGVLGADPLGLVKEEASGDSAMFGCRVPPEEN
jgi:hypothetical protein